jgi:TonB-linked SusC/RagA family outer membrane protein
VQTSAVVSISAAELSQMAPTTSIDNMLQGKAAGVQVTAANGKPGQGAFVRIRGTGSLVAGASSPLYLVDGAPIREQDLSNIPNEDIENITILKDAATTARYGSRGANGVVVITTKNGNRNKDAVIRYSSRYGTTSRINPNYTLMNAEQKLQYEAEMYALGVGDNNLPGVSTEPGSVERQFLLDNALDWTDLILKDGVIQSNAVAISGGADKVDYYFSVSNDRNSGIIDNIKGFERLGTRLNLNFDAKEWLTVGVNAGYSRSFSDEPRDRYNAQNPFYSMMAYNPYETEFILNEDGTIQLDDNGNPVYNPTHTTFPIRGALLSEPNELITNVTLASVDATVKFSKNFSYTFSTAVNHVAARQESYSKPGGILDNLIGDPDFPGNKFDAQTHRLDLTFSNRLNYTLQTNNHNLNVLGLMEYNMNEYNRVLARSIGFPSALLTTQVNSGKPTVATSNRRRLTLFSYGLFADYDYQEKYLLSGSIRQDGSSNFGKDYKYGTFYSASAGWNIAKEDFFSVDAINDLKLRASYGSVGNRTALGPYAQQGNVGFGSGYPGGNATTLSNIENKELKWETTTTLDIGLEFNLFNQRVRGVADYFVRNTTDLLFKIPKADESGVGSVNGNLGEIENKGLEFSLSADVFRNENFKWTLGGNIIFLDHKIVELPNQEDIILDDTQAIGNILWREGDVINQHFYIKYAGVDPATGRPQYYGYDGNIYFAQDLPSGELPNGDPIDNRVADGRSTIADKEGGFFSDITYKGFGLRTDFVFKSGNWVYNIVHENSVGSVSDNQTVDAFNYWQHPGQTDVAPNPRYNSNEYITSDRFLEKGDYIRMRNITLSYTFPSKYLDKTPINTLRIYAQGQNLLTFSKFWGDPEVGLASGESVSFVDTVAPGEATLYSYPNTKSIQIGLDVSF